MPDTPPPELLALIARFEANRDAYRAGTYNETMVRREFIDPLLRLLGWDVDNTKGYAEAYKEVVHEDAVRVGRSTKAPDYSLRIGGQRKLFVEAKKPFVNIKEDIAPAYQVRRYAWSAKLPLSILTDFEEFAVYDCTNRPDQKDDASHSRIMYLRYEQYPEKWGDLLDLFSPDAIMRGSFDKFVQSSKRKRGTAEVDDAFLQEISQWRDELARNIALRNPGITTRQLNYAVQATIDRLIFLRIAEDRGIEGYGRLRDAAQGKEIYAELGRLFQLADAKYNSGLFHFKPEKGRSEAPDTFTLNLTIDDKVLKGIIRRLYYPDSPYQFDVIPADILGQVYEQFLGKVIRLTAGGQAKVEEKPEVKKAGGVFYTPTYIVDYIVAQTVGKLLEGRKPGPKGDASKLRVLDPACGSGSFLLGAYQYLLDWHLEQYRAEADKWARGKEPTLYQNERGDWKLTITERKRILLNNIYGVDIDPQAVEVTKLSLLLKVMEGETEASLGTQLRLLPERVLPDLSANILCGNSLIGPDFYEGQQLSLGLLDEEEMYRINVFDWAAAFPTIVPWGGFDAVIGNPPYIRIQTANNKDTAYYSKQYKSAIKNFDIYCLFVEKGFELLRTNGLLGFILPHRFFKTDYGEGLRDFLSRQKSVTQIVDFDGYMVFENASINTCILHLAKAQNESFPYSVARFYKKDAQIVSQELDKLRHSPTESTNAFACGNTIQMSNLSSSPWIFVWDHERPLWSRLNNSSARLGHISDRIFQGIKTGSDKIYIGTMRQVSDDTVAVRFGIQPDEELIIESELMKPLIKGGEMKKYHIRATEKCILFPYKEGVLLDQETLRLNYPKAWQYLLRHKVFLENRENGKMRGDKWYSYTRSQALNTMHLPKIVTPDYYAHASYGYDQNGEFYFCGGGAGGYGIVVKPEYSPFLVIGLLNSKLVDWYLQKISLRAYQTAFMYVKKYIEQLPLFVGSTNATETKCKRQIEDAAKTMISLKQKLAATPTAHEKTILQRQISATDRQIDQLVYQLYGLTDEEVAIVEG